VNRTKGEQLSQKDGHRDTSLFSVIGNAPSPTPLPSPAATAKPTKPSPGHLWKTGTYPGMIVLF